MNSERIKEIQQETAYPDSVSVRRALLQVWNECEQQDKKLYSEEEVFELTLKSLDLGMGIRQDQLNGYSEKSGKEIHKKWFEQFKKQ